MALHQLFKTPHGIDIPNAYIEVTEFNTVTIKAEEIVEKYKKDNGAFVKVEQSQDNPIDTQLESIKFKAKAWVSKQKKDEGKAAFDVTDDYAVIDFAKHPDMADFYTNFNPQANVMQRLEATCERFLATKLL